jgi:DNA-binding transcriptional MerR regulator
LAIKKSADNNLVTAKQLAEAADESYDTIDHWSDKDLLDFHRRGNKRLYPLDGNLVRCKRIRELQNEGFTLTMIQKQFKKGEI